ncbi:MAG: DUF4405 domain-containing protein [Candidatus Aminicenantes bacterium]|nr:DUF4405 domain-containing protein [Candidatus Aminicenantes bacterium]
MKNRNNLNLLIDILLTVNVALLAGIGWLLKYTLPSGRDRILKTGDNRELLFLGWDRHQWGDVHLVVAVVMVGLLILHIVFHWNQILCLVRNAVPGKALRRVLWVGLTVVALVFFLAAFVIKPEKSDAEGFLYRNARAVPAEASTAETQPATEPDDVSTPSSTVVINPGTEKPGGGTAVSTEPPVASEDHRPGLGGEALLNGRMTLAEAAALYKISTADAKQRLGLPADVPDGETLGRLRRAFGLNMIRIRELLEKKD